MARRKGKRVGGMKGKGRIETPFEAQITKGRGKATRGKRRK
jgi:hypothetical protein